MQVPLDGLPELQSQDTDPLTHIHYAEMAAILERALTEMSGPKQRLVYILKYFEGYSCKDIARITNTTLTGVKLSLARCKRSLNKILSKDPYQDLIAEIL